MTGNATIALHPTHVLSVSQAVTYMDDHYSGMPGHLISEHTVRRNLRTGRWPCTRTADGHMGMTVRDLRLIWREDA